MTTKILSMVAYFWGPLADFGVLTYGWIIVIVIGPKKNTNIYIVIELYKGWKIN